ncbi:MAG: hypothetical protein WBL84_21905 [Xanthobacteraceae bacterium]
MMALDTSWPILEVRAFPGRYGDLAATGTLPHPQVKTGAAAPHSRPLFRMG